MPSHFESKLEDEFYHKFNKLNLKLTLSKDVSHNVKAVRPNKRRIPFDFLIESGQRILAVVEIRSKHLIEIFDYSHIEKFASENDIRFVVLSDGEKFVFTDRRRGLERFILDFDDFVLAILGREEFNVSDIKVKIASVISEIIYQSEFNFLKDSIKELISGSSIDYDELEQVFYFKSPTSVENVENKIFRLLLKDERQISKVFRYTTLNTVYSMLQFNSFRMNCLVGMNDTTEVNYAENYITGTNKDYVLAPWQTVDAMNRRFISSCTLKEDDLTQWRLYADDSKGVCLVFNIHAEKLNPKFIVKRICYGKKNRTHPELDLIKEIISELKVRLNIDFRFKTLNTWRHFFKPADYEVEEEVRILYVQQGDEVKKGWVLTSSHNILNPYVEFNLNEEVLPIHLTEIILGPKSPEKQINQKQFEQFIRELRKKRKVVKEGGEEKAVNEYNIHDLKVSISKINNYR